MGLLCSFCSAVIDSIIFMPLDRRIGADIVFVLFVSLFVLKHVKGFVNFNLCHNYLLLRVRNIWHDFYTYEVVLINTKINDLVIFIVTFMLKIALPALLLLGHSVSQAHLIAILLTVLNNVSYHNFLNMQSVYLKRVTSYSLESIYF